LIAPGTITAIGGHSGEVIRHCIVRRVGDIPIGWGRQ